MGDSDKPKFEPGATMQIDLDQVQLVDLEKVGREGRERSKPPPLPPQELASAHPAAISAPPPRPSAAPAPPPSNAKNLMYVGIIVVVVALAIVAGLAVGRGVGGSAATAAPSASAPAAPVSTPAPVVSQTTQTAPSNEVLVIPPVDVK